MKTRGQSQGFTIVETMIVLAVSGLLFASLALMISGQQSRARFRSSMNDISGKIQQQMNEVATGFYPDDGGFSCTNSGGNVNVTFSAGGNAQGTNDQCILLGRALLFGLPGTDPEQYKAHVLIGVRKQSGGREVTSMRDAGTRALAPGALYNPSWQDKSSTYALQYGTSVAWMRRGDGTEVAGVAFITSPTQTTYGVGGTLDSGSITTDIVPIRKAANGGTPGVSVTEGADLVARVLGIPASDPLALQSSATDGPVQICFVSGSGGQSGLVTIGDNNSTTSIVTEIFESEDCS